MRPLTRGSASTGAQPVIDDVRLTIRSADEESLRVCVPEPTERFRAEVLDGSWRFRFGDPVSAVGFAVDLQARWSSSAELRIGVSQCSDDAGGASRRADGLAALAEGLQILMTQEIFEPARLVGSMEAGGQGLLWLSHGDYQWAAEHEGGVFAALGCKVCEVGIEGKAWLQAPEGSVASRSWVVPSRESILGWRPAKGREVPGRSEFRLQRLLGHGGFGEVWAAKSTESGDLRVFKFCFESQQVAALRREIVLFKLLRQELGIRPDIVRILGWQFETAPNYIEAEYSSGGDLDRWCRNRGGAKDVPLGQRLDLVAQAADALAAAHSVGVLHKDVKPSNILIHESDGRPIAQLTDFGIGELTGREVKEKSGLHQAVWDETESGLIHAATGMYEAPELLEGRSPTVQADIYALGMVLYQAVIGDFERPLASGWQRDVEDPLLGQLIADACDARPSRRLTSASELASRLRSLDETRRRQMEAERREQTRRRHRLQVESWRRRRLALGAVFAGLILFIGVMRVLGSRIEDEVDRAHREERTAAMVSAFLVDIFEGSVEGTGGAPAATPTGESSAEALPVERLLARGARRAADELSEQTEVQARLLSTIGAVQTRLGLFEPARATLERSLEVRRSFYGDDHLETASAFFAAGSVLLILNEVERAERYFQQSLRIREGALGSSSPRLAAPLHKLAHIASRRNQLEQSQAGYDRILRILEQSPGHEVHLGLVLADAARIHEMKGEPYESIEFLRRARALHEKHLPPDHPTLGQLYAVLGDAYSKLGLWDESEPVLLKARAIYEPRVGTDHPYVAAILSALGRVYLQQGRLDESEASLRRSLAIVEPLMGSDNLFLWAPLETLAATLAEQGRLAESLETYDRVINILGQNLSSDDVRLQRLREARAATAESR